MEKLRFEIVSMSPLLMSSPKGMVRGGTTAPGTKKIPSAEDEAEAQTYRMENGQLYMPANAFRSALLGACAGQRIGKRGAKAVMAGSIFLTHECSVLTDPATSKPLHDYLIDVRRCVIQRNAIMRARPRLEKWATEVEFEIDTDFMEPKWVLETLERAGKTIGVGNYRPALGGMFGRFTAKLIGAPVATKKGKKAAS